MLQPSVARRTVLSIRFGRACLAMFLVCFGAVSAAAGLIEALFKDPFRPHGEYFLAAGLAGCAIVAITATWPRSSFSRHFSVPGTTLSIEVGDLFAYPGHLIIGMNDMFDTDTRSVIAPGSVQGQLLMREYADDLPRFDAEVQSSLQNAAPRAVETRQARPKGNLTRYPIGTVAVIGTRPRRYFCVAYGTTDNANYVRSSVDDLWTSLTAVWQALCRHGEREPVSIPVIGAALARVGTMSRSDLIRLIILSYLANSRQTVPTDHLRIVIHPAHAADLNLQELRIFLSAL